MRVKIILNAGGGSAGGAELPGRIVAAFARHGVTAEVAEVPGPELQDAARRALQEGWDAIVAAGGDGTISAVAGALAGSGRPLGVLPLGTLNHFARDLGLPRGLEEAVAVIAAGHSRAVDVAEVNGRVFVNNSSVGLYADMVAERDRRRRLGGWRKGPAMLMASLRMLRRFTRRRLTVRTTGQRHELRSPLVFIGNNLYETSLPRPGTRSALDRGELCLCVTKHQSPLGLLRLGLRAMVGRIRDERDLVYSSVAAVEIDSRLPVLRVSLDGEVMTLPPPLRYVIRPGALTVLAP